MDTSHCWNTDDSVFQDVVDPDLALFPVFGNQSHISMAVDRNYCHPDPLMGTMNGTGSPLSEASSGRHVATANLLANLLIFPVPWLTSSSGNTVLVENDFFLGSKYQPYSLPDSGRLSPSCLGRASDDWTDVQAQSPASRLSSPYVDGCVSLSDIHPSPRAQNEQGYASHDDQKDRRLPDHNMEDVLLSRDRQTNTETTAQNVIFVQTRYAHADAPLHQTLPTGIDNTPSERITNEPCLASELQQQRFTSEAAHQGDRTSPRSKPKSGITTPSRRRSKLARKPNRSKTKARVTRVSSPPATPRQSGRETKLACIFKFAGCERVFQGKNEWKRHINTQHVGQKYYICNEGPCAEIDRSTSPSHPPGVFRNGRVSNRPDLNKQHMRRMHPGRSPPALALVVERCSFPNYLNCPVPGCETESSGSDAWDHYLEHVAGHLQGTAAKAKVANMCFGRAQDCLMTEWAQRADVGVIEYEGKNWKLLDPVTSVMTSKRRTKNTSAPKLSDEDASGEDNL